jgi:transcriptional regulator with XRE-family HTH domain
MASLGQELRKEREVQGLSLKGVADSTRITPKYLEAIETDRFDIFPGEFYVRGVIRSYAKALGLDEDQLIERYRRAGVLSTGGPEIAQGPGSGLRITNKQKLSLAGLAAVVLVIVTFVAYFLTRPGKHAAGPENRGAISQVQQQAAVTPSINKPLPALIPEEEEKGLKLELSFHARTWIQVYADGKLALDGIKLSGEKALITAQNELVIHLGNAGGLDFSINGRPGKGFGRSGAVVKNIRITPANTAEFVRDDGTGVE